MADSTVIPVSKNTRQDLREYKAKNGQTYDEAIQELLNNE
jgi:hypothetical protein